MLKQLQVQRTAEKADRQVQAANQSNAATAPSLENLRGPAAPRKAELKVQLLVRPVSLKQHPGAGAAEALPSPAPAEEQVAEVAATHGELSAGNAIADTVLF